MDMRCPRCGTPAEPAGCEDARAYYACARCRRVWAIPITLLSAAVDDAQPRPRVLVVDDSDMLVEILSGWLEDTGASVMTALSGRAALDVAPGFAPHVAFVDVVLPPPDGWRVAEALRAQCQSEVILMTGIPGPAVRARALEAGITLLEKPFTQDEVLAALAGALARAGCSTTFLT
jgi:CheY-like chemotaxis protein